MTRVRGGPDRSSREAPRRRWAPPLPDPRARARSAGSAACGRARPATTNPTRRASDGNGGRRVHSDGDGGRSAALPSTVVDPLGLPLTLADPPARRARFAGSVPGPAEGESATTTLCCVVAPTGPVVVPLCGRRDHDSGIRTTRPDYALGSRRRIGHRLRWRQDGGRSADATRRQAGGWAATLCPLPGRIGHRLRRRQDGGRSADATRAACRQIDQRHGVNSDGGRCEPIPSQSASTGADPSRGAHSDDCAASGIRTCLWRRSPSKPANPP